MTKRKFQKIKSSHVNVKETRKMPSSGYPEAQGKGKKIQGYPLKKGKKKI